MIEVSPSICRLGHVKRARILLGSVSYYSGNSQLHASSFYRAATSLESLQIAIMVRSLRPSADTPWLVHIVSQLLLDLPPSVEIKWDLWSEIQNIARDLSMHVGHGLETSVDAMILEDIASRIVRIR